MRRTSRVGCTLDSDRDNTNAYLSSISCSCRTVNLKIRTKMFPGSWCRDLVGSMLQRLKTPESLGVGRNLGQRRATCDFQNSALLSTISKWVLSPSSCCWPPNGASVVLESDTSDSLEDKRTNGMTPLSASWPSLANRIPLHQPQHPEELPES